MFSLGVLKVQRTFVHGSSPEQVQRTIHRTSLQKSTGQVCKCQVLKTAEAASATGLHLQLHSCMDHVCPRMQCRRVSDHSCSVQVLAMVMSGSSVLEMHGRPNTPDIISQQRVGFEVKGLLLDHFLVCLCGLFVYVVFPPPNNIVQHKIIQQAIT